MPSREPPQRIITPMDKKLVERIDDFRFERRLPSRAEAIRQLIDVGLKQSEHRTRRPKP
jgi:metal-responsive CopG/Arc/MetJ family transcriptional regulator